MQVIPELLDWVCWHGRFYQVRDRTRNKTTKAITLYLCNCQQQECYYPQERVPLEECKPTVAHIRKPGWSGYIHSIPWGLEGICADVIWLKSPIDPKTGELLPLPTMPQRYPVKDLIKPQEILEKPLCERHQDNGLRPSNYLSLNDGGFALALLQQQQSERESRQRAVANNNWLHHPTDDG